MRNGSYKPGWDVETSVAPFASASLQFSANGTVTTTESAGDFIKTIVKTFNFDETKVWNRANFPWLEYPPPEEGTTDYLWFLISDPAYEGDPNFTDEEIYVMRWNENDVLQSYTRIFNNITVSSTDSLPRGIVVSDVFLGLRFKLSQTVHTHASYAPVDPENPDTPPPDEDSDEDLEFNAVESYQGVDANPDTGDYFFYVGFDSPFHAASEALDTGEVNRMTLDGFLDLGGTKTWDYVGADTDEHYTVTLTLA